MKASEQYLENLSAKWTPRVHIINLAEAKNYGQLIRLETIMDCRPDDSDTVVQEYEALKKQLRL